MLISRAPQLKGVVLTMDDVLLSRVVDVTAARLMPATWDAPPTQLEWTNWANAMRCLRTLRFSAPLHVIGTTDVFSWLRRASIHIVNDGAVSHGSNGRIVILRKTINNEWLKRWDNGSGVGMIGFLGLLVHEGVHAINGLMHKCRDGENDVGMNGAWGAQIEFFRALSRSQQLTEAQRASAWAFGERLFNSGAVTCGLRNMTMSRVGFRGL